VKLKFLALGSWLLALGSYSRLLPKQIFPLLLIMGMLERGERISLKTNAQ
jgi:hypothetical protein